MIGCRVHWNVVLLLAMHMIVMMCVLSEVESVLAHTANGTVDISSYKTGARIVSSNSNYTMIMQGDGNLVVYFNFDDGRRTVPIWSSGSQNQGRAPHQLTLRGDGALVVTDSTGAVTWQAAAGAGTVVAPTLRLNDDGTLVVADAATGDELWNSHFAPEDTRLSQVRGFHYVTASFVEGMLAVDEMVNIAGRLLGAGSKSGLEIKHVGLVVETASRNMYVAQFRRKTLEWRRVPSLADGQRLVHETVRGGGFYHDTSWYPARAAGATLGDVHSLAQFLARDYDLWTRNCQWLAHELLNEFSDVSERGRLL